MSPRARPRVVLDTNTIVSALDREGPARDILRLFYRGTITVVVSPCFQKRTRITGSLNARSLAGLNLS